jgi:hypothetical protein
MAGGVDPDVHGIVFRTLKWSSVAINSASDEN